MFAKLDALTGTAIFENLYKDYANAEGFPDLQKTWESLGITIDDKRVSLQSDAPMANIREAIMKG